MRSRRLQPILVVASGILVLAIFSLPISRADNRVAAIGICLQTLAGFFAAIQLWGNNASDGVVSWIADQIDARRWYIAGIFDGRPASLVIAVAWYAAANVAIGLLSAWEPSPILGWILTIPLLLILVGGAIAMLLTLALWGGAVLVGDHALPEGRALTSLRDRFNENDWIWPIVGVAFLLGGMLQLAVA